MTCLGPKDITASDDPLEITLAKDDFTMNSKIHISIIVVRKRNRVATPMIQIDGLDSSEQAKQTVFTKFDEEGRLCVAFHAQHDEWLEEQAISYSHRISDRWS